MRKPLDPVLFFFQIVYTSATGRGGGQCQDFHCVRACARACVVYAVSFVLSLFVVYSCDI